jgi:hypothetical protein
MEAVRDGEESNREAGRNKRAATIMEVRGARSEERGSSVKRRGRERCERVNC